MIYIFIALVLFFSAGSFAVGLEIKPHDPLVFLAFTLRGFDIYADGEKIGTAGLDVRKPDKNSDEIRCELFREMDEKARGKGLGTQISQFLIEEGFSRHECREVYALNSPENPASFHSNIKAGMKCEWTSPRNYTCRITFDEWD